MDITGILRGYYGNVDIDNDVRMGFFVLWDVGGASDSDSDLGLDSGLGMDFGALALRYY
jgi:hypothetical protein